VIEGPIFLKSARRKKASASAASFPIQLSRIMGDPEKLRWLLRGLLDGLYVEIMAERRGFDSRHF
jgi:hypothetical protein